MKEVKDQILSVVNGKSVLFLERDMGLYNCDGNLEKFLIDNKQKYNVLYDISSLPMTYIVNQLEWYDVIVFQTTWIYDISTQISELLFNHKFQQDKCVIECVGGVDGTWSKLPKDMANDHKMFIFNDMAEDYEEEWDELWEFKELRKDKFVWED